MSTATETSVYGQPIKRREDPRFITGRGQYVDDVRLPGMTYAAFVRSPARARPDSRHRRREGQGVPGRGGGVHRQGHDRGQFAAVRLGPPEGQEHPRGGARPHHAAPHAPGLGRSPARGRSGGHRHRRQPGGGARRSRAGGGGLGASPGGYGHGAGGSGGPAAGARVRPRQRGIQVGDRRPGCHGRGLRVGAGHGQEAHRQSAARRQRHGATGVCGAIRGGHRGADPVGDLAESPRAPAAHGRLRAGHSRAQDAGDRPRRRGRLRLEDLRLQRGSRAVLGHPPDQAPGAVDGLAARSLSDRRPGPRPRDRRGDRALRAKARSSAFGSRPPPTSAPTCRPSRRRCRLSCTERS